MKLLAKDFAEILGENDENIFAEIMAEDNFDYEILEGKERDNAILSALKRIENDTQIVATPERTEVWQNGWNENLQEFIKSDFDLSSLMPKYFLREPIFRLKQQYIKAGADFSQKFERVMYNYLFKKYFQDFSAIYEFGCGTGKNLVLLAQIFPDKQIIGSDFVQSSVDLVNLIGKEKKLNIQGARFDMIQPDRNFKLKADSAIFTSGSIEQLDNQYRNFVDYLLENKPKLCVHIEPMAEFYDQNNLIDYIAYKFHTKRHYPSGLIDLLKKFETEGKVEILKLHRVAFGNLNHESYNQIIWRPIK